MFHTSVKFETHKNIKQIVFYILLCLEPCAAYGHLCIQRMLVNQLLLCIYVHALP